MDKSTLVLTPGLTPELGYAVMIGLGLFSLLIAIIIRTYLVRNTHDFIISDRKVGFGFGVGSVIAVWTWAMAVMMSAAMTFQWGLSGLFCPSQRPVPRASTPAERASIGPEGHSISVRYRRSTQGWGISR